MESKGILYFSSQRRHSNMVYNKNIFIWKNPAVCRQKNIMSYSDAANSPLLYVLVAAGVLHIVGPSAFFLRKSWRWCLELEISKEKLSTVARSSAAFTTPLCLYRQPSSRRSSLSLCRVSSFQSLSSPFWTVGR